MQIAVTLHSIRIKKMKVLLGIPFNFSFTFPHGIFSALEQRNEDFIVRFLFTKRPSLWSLVQNFVLDTI